MVRFFWLRLRHSTGKTSLYHFRAMRRFSRWRGIQICIFFTNIAFTIFWYFTYFITIITWFVRTNNFVFFIFILSNDFFTAIINNFSFFYFIINKIIIIFRWSRISYFKNNIFLFKFYNFNCRWNWRGRYIISLKKIKI